MKVRSGFAELGARPDGLRSEPIVSDTYWGYVIRPAEPRLERAAMIEMVATFAGVVVLLTAYSQWFMPGTNFEADLLALKLTATVIFIVFGAALIWVGRQGLVQETQVDRVKSELRLVQRNRFGEGRVTCILPFGEVTSVVLRRPGSPLRPSRLSLRLARNGGLIEILTAGEIELLPIRDRLIVDMSPRFRPGAPSHHPHETDEVHATEVFRG